MGGGGVSPLLLPSMPLPVIVDRVTPTIAPKVLPFAANP
jgi:hypothetical protein